MVWRAGLVIQIETRSYEGRNRSNHLFYRIIQCKTVSHFCWKCSKARILDRVSENILLRSLLRTGNKR
ncbi:hypothetical protein BKD02_01270 [Brucella sp. 09RB8910]|nr:hypothetical protein BKD02_01270 [Brucella sp. 09RB8910]